MKASLTISFLAIAGSFALKSTWKNHEEYEPAKRSVDQLVGGGGTVMDLKRVRAAGANAIVPLRAALTRKQSILAEIYTSLRLSSPDWLQQHLPQPPPVDELRANAAALAGELGPAAKDLLPELVALLKNNTADGNAAWALGQLGQSADEAVPALVTALDEERPLAASALGNMGRSATLALPALKTAAQNGPPWLRAEAKHAIEAITTRPEAEPRCSPRKHL